MPAGTIKRAFAFEVTPRQVGPFQGGRLPSGSPVQAALDATYDVSRISTAPVVNFQIDTSDPARAHPIRDAVILIGFGSSAEALTAAGGLAARLANAMDNRSKPTLLMVTVHDVAQASRRRVVAWTFPQEEVFRLGTHGGRPQLDLMDAFNRESRLRKAALLEGGQGRADLLSARVLDFQQTSTDRSVADLWVSKFLDARVQMGSEEGTRILAKALRHAHDRAKRDIDAQAQVHAAIGGLRTGPKTRWSIDDVARTFFDPDMAAVFTANLRPEERAAPFDVDRGRLDAMLQYRIFELDNGVLVSAPFSEVGTPGVRVVADGAERRLTATGLIESEKVRSRGN